MKTDFFKNLNLWQKISGTPDDHLIVVYGGDQSYQTSNGNLLSWKKYACVSG